jgi:DNA processing protein
VPGPIDSPQSQGCNLLIQQGAHIVTCVNDVFALLGLPPEREERPVLPANEQKLWDLLSEQGASTADMLGARSGLPIREMLTALTSLELDGLVEMDPGGVYRPR